MPCLELYYKYIWTCNVCHRPRVSLTILQTYKEILGHYQLILCHTGTCKVLIMFYHGCTMSLTILQLPVNVGLTQARPNNNLQDSYLHNGRYDIVNHNKQ